MFLRKSNKLVLDVATHYELKCVTGFYSIQRNQLILVYYSTDFGCNTLNEICIFLK